MQANSDNLAEVLDARAVQAPSAPFLDAATAGSFTNADFSRRARSLASRFVSEAGTSNAIAVSAESSTLLPFIIWGTILAGVDLWLLPSFPSAERLADYTRDLPFRRVYSDIPELTANDRWRPLTDVLHGDDPHKGSADISSRHSAFVFQTSGTEGTPKSIRCEHWKFARVLTAMREGSALNHARDARVFISQPLTHSYGLCTFLEYTSVGGSFIFAERSPLGPAGSLMHESIRKNVEAIEGVPYFWGQFAQLLHKVRLPALRHVGLGGGPPNFTVMRKVVEHYPEVTMSIRYGLTETPSVVTHKVYSAPHGDHWLSSGRRVSAYSLQIRDEFDKEVTHGVEGEIVVSGECVSAPSGTLHTGDLGYIDASGELIVTGRRSAFIKRRGYRLSPEVIESAAGACSGVGDCRAFGRDDTLILQVVASNDFVSTSDLQRQLRERLPQAMLPDHVELVAEIPRTYSGKVKRA